MMQSDSLLIAKAAADCVKKIDALTKPTEDQESNTASNLAMIDLNRGSIKRIYTKNKKLVRY
jgi:hypothetical protein